jgi:hypothetical protein
VSTRWQREADKGNEAAVQYKDDRLKEAHERIQSPDYNKLERKTLNRMLQGGFASNYFFELESDMRARKHAERKEEQTFRDIPRSQFFDALFNIAGLPPLTTPRRTPEQERTWGEWADRLEEHDRSERILPSQPGWGRVVSRDTRATQPEAKPAIDTVGVEAASEERAPEAKALFAALLAQPETVTMTACACGKIGMNVCMPVQVTLDKRSKYLQIKGGKTKYLSFSDHKALSEHRIKQGKYAEEHELAHAPHSLIEETDTYE